MFDAIIGWIVAAVAGALAIWGVRWKLKADRATGVNPQTHIAILPQHEPEATDAREGVKTGEFGSLQDDPPPKPSTCMWRV